MTFFLEGFSTTNGVFVEEEGGLIFTICEERYEVFTKDERLQFFDRAIIVNLFLCNLLLQFIAFRLYLSKKDIKNHKLETIVIILTRKKPPRI
jgi:hypothetical protein